MSESKPAHAVQVSEVHNTRVIWSEANVHEFLSASQHTALASLAEGKSIRETAQAAGVHRNTVMNWIRSDAAFRAAYNAWRQEVTESARARILGLAEGAADAVAKAVAKGDPKIGLAILKELGLTRPHKPGSVHPGLVREALEASAEKRDKKLLDTRAFRRICLEGRRELHDELSNGPPAQSDSVDIA